jgi:hypothetical protein
MYVSSSLVLCQVFLFLSLLLSYYLSEAQKFFAHHGLELVGAELPILVQQLTAQRHLSKIIFNQVDRARGWQILKETKSTLIR